MPLLPRLAKAVANRAGLAWGLGLRRLGLGGRPSICYVVPRANWSLDWDGHYITSGINRQFGRQARLTSAPRWLVGQIVHYGSLWSFLDNLGGRHNHRNKVVATVFHGDRDGEIKELARAMDLLVENAQEADRIVTSCRIMAKRLIDWGLPPEKVQSIPLGVDLTRFRPPGPGERLAARRLMGVPEGAICIGSFQKDGCGWGQGLEPKAVKGPDVFLKVIERLKDSYRLFVCLSGPARGFVKQGLDRLGVPYWHRFFEDYLEVAQLYRGLDLYLITSREEGGPKSVLEALASGVPLVSTRVGLAPDVIQDSRNGLLAESEDVAGLAGQAARLMDQPGLGTRLAAEGLETIKAYDWPLIAARYYREVYAPLMGREEA